ncbi:MAG: ribonuclease H-like domain-containing protein [Chitinophagaceae bacterium]|nr:ribonuclease H-like domain-containing protein [Chitinophagaceae bacterium]
MDKIQTGNLIFLDIETVPGNPDFQSLPDVWQELWNKKVARLVPEGITPEDFYSQQSALYAEFGRVVCICIGYYRSDGTERKLRVKALAYDDEAKILKQFNEMITQFENHHKNWIFAGHNIREFDLPYLSRRMLINGLDIPQSMSFQKLKPWDIPVFDTMHFWRFVGDYRNYTSLDLLATALGIPSPKEDINGSQVAEVFYKEKNLKRIAAYCSRDVVCVANIVRKLNREPLLAEEQIEMV